MSAGTSAAGHVPFAGDKEQEAAAQAILLLCIIADLELDASDVDLLVAEARKLADGWLASQVHLYITGPENRGRSLDALAL
jgi:hypothetical protein